MSRQRSYYNGERSEVKPFLPNRYKRVLEIGCGNGGFRKMLPDTCEYWGVEPERTAATEAEQRLDKVLVGTFDDVSEQLPDGYFDLVVCNDVIEHLSDHCLFLRTIRKKMSDEGVIVGSIPNVRYYKNLFALIVRRDWRYTDKGILDATHLRFFTQKSFQRSLRESGFSREKMRGINSAVYLKQQYCTSPARTAGNVLKYILRLIGFLSVDIITLGHSADMKYAQFGFRFRRDPDEASSQFLS